MHRWLVAGLLIIVLCAAYGCRGDKCRQMLQCCEAASDLEGVGSACGDMATNVRNPDTCHTIVETVRYMYQDRGEDIPEDCKVD